MNQNSRENPAKIKNKMETYVDLNFHRQHSFRLSEVDEEQSNLDSSKLWSKGHNREYDEIDLLSECSTPISYVPGKYLQLIDLSPDADRDIQMWSTLNSQSPTDKDMTSLFPGSLCLDFHNEYMQSQTVHSSPRLTLTRSRFVLPLTVCVVIALAALGGLAVFI